MIHLTLQQLSAYLDDELPEASVELVRRHLSQCPECTVRFGKVEALEETLVRLLQHDPGDAFFDYFRDTVTFDEGGAAGHVKRPPATKPSHTTKPPSVAKPSRDVKEPLAEKPATAAKPAPKAHARRPARWRRPGARV
ncbi:MAG TPA: zf-HC2 domain-containing protein [Acidobacteriota bacterium]|nr:zf-HC2 domain-containing protein [Acidobacteriota bacterium]